MSVLTRFFASPRPTVAVEIASRHVAALRLGDGQPPAIDGYAIEPLADGLVVPSLGALNLPDPPAVASAVGRALGQIGGARHVALVVPDSVAKVSLIRFEQVPASPRDLEAMLRWQMRKSVPFKIDEAQLAWTPGADLEGGGREFAVALARRDVISQYEAVCASGGAHPGVVDLATFNLVNLQLAARRDQGDWLLVHLAADYLSIAIVRNGTLIFFRHRGAEGDASLADLVHQTAMYYEDRLSGKGFSHVLLAGASHRTSAGGSFDSLRRSLEERLGARVDAVDPRTAVADRASTAPELLDRLAPLVGILVREAA